jgi:hypothetical protein
MEFIEKHPNKPWDYCYSLSYTSSIEFIEKNPDIPWNWWAVSQNPNVTIEFIEKILIYRGIGNACHLILILQWNSLKTI